MDGSKVTFFGCKLQSCTNVPPGNEGPLILATLTVRRSQTSTAKREHCRIDRALAAAQGAPAHLGGPLAGCGQHLLAVCREDCRIDLGFVTLQGEQALPRGSRPHLRGPVD